MPKGLKPWEKLGVSKSKWYRDNKKPPAPSVKRRKPHKMVAALQEAMSEVAARKLSADPVWRVVEPDEADQLRIEREVGDRALVAEFLAVTAPEFCGNDHIYHRISPGVIAALRRTLSHA